MRLGRFCCYVMLKDEELMYLDVRDDFIEYNVINEVPLRNIWEFKKQITVGDIFRISEGRQLYDDYWFKFVPQDSDTLE